MFAPIVLFVYNRPWHTLRTLEALSNNHLADQSRLYIFADGPKPGVSQELLNAIHETRTILHSKKWCKETVIFESDTNRGLADSIITGVGEIINRHGKVIVLEDDLVSSPGFLVYMNDALELYEQNESVMHISGYMYPVCNQVENATVFLRVLSCWGWGTWKRAWNYFSNDVENHLLRLDSRSGIRKFNVLGNAPFYNQLLDNARGSINTWAVKWYASWFLKNGIALFPATTLIVNIGHDGSGVHCGKEKYYQANFIADKIDVKVRPIIEDKRYLRLIDSFYAAVRKNSYPQRRKSIFFRIKSKLRMILKALFN